MSDRVDSKGLCDFDELAEHLPIWSEKFATLCNISIFSICVVLSLSGFAFINLYYSGLQKEQLVQKHNQRKEEQLFGQPTLASDWNFYVIPSTNKQYSLELQLYFHYLLQHPRRSIQANQNTLFAISEHAVLPIYGKNKAPYLSQTDDKLVKHVTTSRKRQLDKSVVSQHIKEANHLAIEHLYVFSYQSLALPFNVGRISQNTFVDDLNYKHSLDISLPTATFQDFGHCGSHSSVEKKYNISFQGQVRPTYGDEWFNNKPKEKQSEFSDHVYNLTNMSNKIRIANVRYKLYKHLSVAGGVDGEQDVVISLSMKSGRTISFAYNYTDLMCHSHFCMVVGGDAPWSYRFMEAISAGCIPLVVYNGWELPYRQLINWKSLVVFIAEHTINDLVQTHKLTPRYLKTQMVYNSSQFKYNMQTYYDDSLTLWHQAIIQVYCTYFADYKVRSEQLITAMKYNHVRASKRASQNDSADLTLPFIPY